MASKMSRAKKDVLKYALIEYGAVIKKSGWRAGNTLIKKYKKVFPDFDKWALALRVMLRAGELLETERK